MEALLLILIFHPILLTLLVVTPRRMAPYPHPIEVVSPSYRGGDGNRAHPLFRCR
jgi:hypothetical protein